MACVQDRSEVRVVVVKDEGGKCVDDGGMLGMRIRSNWSTLLSVTAILLGVRYC